VAKFDVETYRAELAKLKEQVREMDEAIDNMKFECGPGGVSDRATSHLREFLNAMELANKQQAEVSKAMIMGLQL